LPTSEPLLRIACLHTAASNIAIFDAAADALGISPDQLSHHARPDLLAAAGKAGGLTLDIQLQTREILLSLAEGADLILLTCSTLGPAASEANALLDIPVWRVDQALAEQSMATAGKTRVLYAAQTTLGPTQRLFEQVPRHPQADVEFQWVEGAWEHFLAGNIAGYLQRIAAQADLAFQQGVERVALAQASMTGAGNLTQFGVPLSSPLCALRDAIQFLRTPQRQQNL
jgi:hypothetical protein